MCCYGAFVSWRLGYVFNSTKWRAVYFSQYGDGNDPGCNLGVPDQNDNGKSRNRGNIVLAQYLLKIFQIAAQVLR